VYKKKWGRGAALFFADGPVHPSFHFFIPPPLPPLSLVVESVYKKNWRNTAGSFFYPPEASPPHLFITGSRGICVYK